MTRWILGGVLLVAAAVLPAARPVFLVALMVLPGFALERLIRGRRSSSPDWLAVLLLAIPEVLRRSRRGSEDELIIRSGEPQLREREA